MKSIIIIAGTFLLMLFALSTYADKDMAKDLKPQGSAKAKKSNNNSNTKESNKSVEKSYKGTILSARTAGNYTYLQLNVEGKEIWIATMPEYLKVSVSRGDKVEYVGGIEMTDFTSKGFGKTFDTILFITRIKVIEKNNVAIPADDYHKMSTRTLTKALPPKKGDIKKLKGGKTIAEIFAEREQLKDKQVILRAKVMKVSRNILKRNWVTLQDGTGNAPNDKITLVTKQNPSINSIVTVYGIVKTDINLGAGYKYKVLIQDFDKKE